jgi:glucose-6-phosphate 1-dehydrogenase
MNSAIENPFREGLLMDRPAEPCAIVIFGATGDLAQRKLFPALLHLCQEDRISRETVFLAVSRSGLELQPFREKVLASAKEFAPDSVTDEAAARKFLERIFVHSEDTTSDEPFHYLQDHLNRLADSHGTRGNLLFYLSIPPTGYEALIRKLGASGFANTANDRWARIIIEKPFGRDLTSALHLNSVLEQVFHEDQVYRIDHYLGKETVQNILVLRLANILFEPLWNYKYIDHVQITAAESLGVEDRAQYYDEFGALRDMIQNHLLQILSMIAMEPPATLSAEAIRDEKIKVLKAIHLCDSGDIRECAIRAQYAAGAVGGKVVPDYLNEQGVKMHSRIETFAALRLRVDNWRWTGVPFYLRTGKRLSKRATEVAIQFKNVPHMVFESSPLDLMEPNVLSIRIQPNEGISLKFVAKLPGLAVHLRPVDMEFRYGASFGGRISDAYERLLLDAMNGDQTLFARGDQVIEGWKFAEPILSAWERDATSSLPTYVAGSWGPPEADTMIASDGRTWRKL